MIIWMKNVRMLLSICLIFCQFQTGVAYKSVAYKKACSLAIFESIENNDPVALAFTLNTRLRSKCEWAALQSIYYYDDL